MTEKITKLALASRIFILILQLISNHLLNDHKPDVFRSPVDQDVQYTWLDNTIEYCFGGLRHWDGEYFLHIAEHDYSYENTLAFFPLYPVLIRFGAHLLYFIGIGLSLRSCTLLVAVLLNLYLFCESANLIYNLTQRIFNDPNKSWNAALLFCINPASIFFTAAYSEAMFCWLSLRLMLLCISDMNVVYTTTSLALSIIGRSNGLVNIGFPIYFTFRKIVLNSSQRCYAVMKLLICLVCGILPITFFYSYAFRIFCQPDKVVHHSKAIKTYATERDYILSGQRLPDNSPWCDNTLPFPYSYIQSNYWNVGFLHYYQLKQLPNFLLAAPILFFICYHSIVYLKNLISVIIPKFKPKFILKEQLSLPFVIHALFLTVFCIFFVHIQISTRLLCSASPCLYWFAADYMPKSFYQIHFRTKLGLILAWFSGYSILGTIMFSNNLPWT